MQRRILELSVIAAALCVFGTGAAATEKKLPHRTLKEVAQQAVLNSPEVRARWHAFQETSEEVGVVRGGFLPRIDATGGKGKEKLDQPSAGINDNDYTRKNYTLSLNQMLFDGLLTYNEVKRAGRARLVRYFEFLDASENIALESSRAYLDVVRYRYRVHLAEQNYIQHRIAFEQLKRRAESGVGRRVDVEQAGSRLALADVNLTTEMANLHDVTARFTRIVGEVPPAVAFVPAQLSRGVPGSMDTALDTALKHNPALRASVENSEAAQYELSARRSAFMPKLELRARTENIDNYQGTSGERTNNVVEAVVTYNLFNGFSDVYRNRQYAERKNIALDQREKACRDMRQTLSIAYNDISRLNDQLSFIGIQVRLVQKTRDAYRDQFNIGQRSLLDLLDTQNELFNAQLAQVNADADLSLAYVRSFAGMGRLLEQLGLKQVDPEGAPGEDEMTKPQLDQLCPPIALTSSAVDRESLNYRALEAMNTNASLIGGTVPGLAAAAAVEAPAVVADEGAVVVDSEVEARIAAWSAAWSAKEVAAYLAFYAPEFKPEGALSRADWEAVRSKRLQRPGGIRIDVSKLEVVMRGKEVAVTTFRQDYTAEGLRDTSDKVLEWKKIDGQWKIVREVARTVGPRGQ
ncbi:MAG: outer membrane protein adhesin transport system [Pseudomonadota bacterium]|nr:outer membrane protein adhesin transport system [Pseudomonadota bacterium]